MQRREILAGKKQLNEKGEIINAEADGGLEFIDEDVKEEDQEAIQGEVRPGEEANIVKIVTQNLIKKFSTDAKTLKQAKQILKGSPHVPVETVQLVKDAYAALKDADYASVLHQLQDVSSETREPTALLTSVRKGVAKVVSMQPGQNQQAAAIFLSKQATKLL